MVPKKRFPQSHVLLDVDDLPAHGDKDILKEQLKRTFKFGRWVDIYGTQSDYCGRTSAQRPNYSFKIHQAKFIPERLKPIPIARGQAGNNESLTTDAEQTMLRAALGCTNWVQRGSKLDAAGTSCLY